MGKAMGRESLDHMGCSAPDCKGGHTDPVLYLHANCHPASALTVAYHRDYGQLCFWCETCGEIVGFVAVAEKDSVVGEKDDAQEEVNREQN